MRTNFNYYLDKFKENLQARNLKLSTIKGHARRITPFIVWAENLEIKNIQSVTKQTLDDYQKYLLRTKIETKAPHLQASVRAKALSYEQRRGRLSSLRMWFHWLCRRNTLLFNPLGELDMPIQKHRIPKDVLTEKEAEKILRQPNTSNSIGLRDKAILEVLYSTGVRRSELVNLRLDSINNATGILYIHQGKGSRDRFIPISNRALKWLDKYLETVRPDFEVSYSKDFLFLAESGIKLSAEDLGSIVKHYIDKSKVNKEGNCHMFRHTMATLMLENGADLRYIQEMLGHKQIKTTQLYTKVSITKLQSVYEDADPFSNRGI